MRHKLLILVFVAGGWLAAAPGLALQLAAGYVFRGDQLMACVSGTVSGQELTYYQETDTCRAYLDVHAELLNGSDERIGHYTWRVQHSLPEDACTGQKTPPGWAFKRWVSFSGDYQRVRLWATDPISGRSWHMDTVLRELSQTPHQPILLGEVSLQWDTATSFRPQLLHVPYRADAREQVAFRLALFRRGDGQRSALSVGYESVWQQPLVFTVSPNDTLLELPLPRFELEPNEYLLECFLLDGAQIAAQRDIAFRVRWPGLDSLPQQPAIAQAGVAALGLAPAQPSHAPDWRDVWQVRSRYRAANLDDLLTSYYRTWERLQQLYPELNVPVASDLARVVFTHGLPDELAHRDEAIELRYYGAKLRFLFTEAGHTVQAHAWLLG